MGVSIQFFGLPTALGLKFVPLIVLDHYGGPLHTCCVPLHSNEYIHSSTFHSEIKKNLLLMREMYIIILDMKENNSVSYLHTNPIS